ncbi:hypothetical protein CFC21_010444 [Triticum aestivum]|uniref:F-box domain-containing protein n=2 Tax=Triticum aestivum TaxID=4565 RepID=A0A3B6U6M2_WHEAT|nr:uncharacterized protein LOC123172999 [Triticum aestivum]KAF6993568.1 hypothetical protein CFC21_010444 [Triticum aestivum]
MTCVARASLLVPSMSEEGEMSSLRRRRRSPAASPLEDDDLLSEILLRLPPQPSSLPRASVVCKSWRRLVTDPQFRRRFRLRHRRNPPLLGFFNRFDGLSFQPTLDAPDRVPLGRFPLQRDDGDYFVSLGCRHGLLLIFLPERLQILVWDPVTGDQHRLTIPPVVAERAEKIGISGAVYRAAGDVQQFQVFLAVTDGDGPKHRRALACVYSSKTCLWGNLISTPIPHQAHGSQFFTMVTGDALLAGDSLYWVLAGNLDGILEFDLEKQSLAVIQPVDVRGRRHFKLMWAEGGGLGFLFISESDRYTAQLWKRLTGRDAIASWVLARTIELDKLLSLNPEEEERIVMLGFVENNNVLLLWTVVGVFTIHLESLKFKKLFKTMQMSHYHPFESV